jgi:hypothetical protein
LAHLPSIGCQARKWFRHKLIGSIDHAVFPQEIAMYGMRAQDNAPATHFRSDRICRVNGELYFSTRENTLEGPFADAETAAMREIQAYIERMQLCSIPEPLTESPASRASPLPQVCGVQLFVNATNHCGSGLARDSYWTVTKPRLNAPPQTTR